jgi:predicted RecB family nuclease
MRYDTDGARLSATDLSNHLACHHLTSLDLSVARGQRNPPEWAAPDRAVIQELGLRHEAAYVRHLQDAGLAVEDLRGIKDEQEAIRQTLACMERGVEVIAQGSLSTERWFGRPDILRKSSNRSRFGEWSYEAYDCKLSRETKAATILQLAVYSTLLEENQGAQPEHMYVVPANKGFEAEAYRIAEYTAYYRYVRARLEDLSANEEKEQTYPEPCMHCEVCRWFGECNAIWRRDDHLSLVAGITRSQRNQFNLWQIKTMADLSSVPVPLERKPLHGSKEACERAINQARVQVQGRQEQRPVRELLRVEDGIGFCRLPEPSPGDMFLDLEGDPFVGDVGRQYLFGFLSANNEGQWLYEKKWGLTADDEKQAFEWVVDEIMRRWEAFREMHVYHFGAYEPSELKRLMGRYATKEEEIDRMLRAGLFVDLHTLLKQSLRASVEQYGLKQLESLYGFQRITPLGEARASMRYIERWLELEWGGNLPENVRTTIEGYNEDDCRSTLSMRDWLEAERKSLANEKAIPRPPICEGAPSEALEERQQAVAALAYQLTSDVPNDFTLRTNEQHARWLLAQLLDWHRREDKAVCWRYFKLAEMDDEDLLDERPALAGLEFVRRALRARGLPIDTYSFPSQDTEVRAGNKVCHRKLNVGEVQAINLAERLVEIKKTKACLDVHPQSIFVDERGPNPKVLAESLFRIGEWVRDNAIDSAGRFRAARDFLRGLPPRLLGNGTISARIGENSGATACRVVSSLDNSTYAIQGPPGAGKTHTAAMIVCKLVSEGKKVGVTAFSHKAIGNLLDKIQELADENQMDVWCIQKVKEQEEEEKQDRHIETTTKNEVPLVRLQGSQVRVAAGTVWLWARPEYFESVDVLVIDEAGQMSLANVVAAAQATKNLVLIGDPQQLDQPLQGCHPPGAEKSALEHLLGDHKTIPETMGLLIPETRRLHPNICAFTSEIFYEGKLNSHQVTRNRVLEGHPFLSGAGLWFLPVAHQSNRNASPEEVAMVAQVVGSLLRPEVRWFRGLGSSRQLTLEDILIVAPYNAQVSDLLARLPEGARVGTVDKFQGQDAPVVIYSLTTSSPEDAPRGMEFLYSLNRLNVATSRGMSTVVVVGSPRLFEPECRTPRQIQLANALCRFAEMAQIP